ncbi:hypothetical protein D3C78_1646660 [compost metagenome]
MLVNKLLGRVAVAVHDQQVWILNRTALDEEEQDQTDDDRADDCESVEACSCYDTCNSRPEQEDQVCRVLDRRSEPNDGQRANHTEREHEIGVDGNNNDCGDHRHADK